MTLLISTIVDIIIFFNHIHDCLNDFINFYYCRFRVHVRHLFFGLNDFINFYYCRSQFP